MTNNPLPRWSAPVVGFGLGLVLGAASIPADEAYFWMWLFGPALGLFAGTIVLILDRPNTRNILENEGTESTSRSVRSPSQSIASAVPPHSVQMIVHSDRSMGSSFLAIVALIVCLMPFLGWGFCLMAVLANRGDRGWPRVVSWIAASCAILEALFIAFVFLMAAME